MRFFTGHKARFGVGPVHLLRRRPGSGGMQGAELSGSLPGAGAPRQARFPGARADFRVVSGGGALPQVTSRSTSPPGRYSPSGAAAGPFELVAHRGDLGVGLWHPQSGELPGQVVLIGAERREASRAQLADQGIGLRAGVPAEIGRPARAEENRSVGLVLAGIEQPGLANVGHLPAARRTLGAGRSAVARRRARPDRPRRGALAAALRPAAVTDRRHDHQPGHQPRPHHLRPVRPSRHSRPRGRSASSSPS
jgi:hypothetical protein